MKIGIAGCGGLGSNVAYHLVRNGINYIKFGDFDKIESSNLNRQFYFQDQIGLLKSETLSKNLLRINPKANFDFENIKFNKENIIEFFKDCNLIVEAFDSKESKIMLIEELLPLNKIIISASGVANFNINTLTTKEVTKNLFIVGDFKTDIKENKTYSHKVGAAACLMAELALKKGGFYEN